MSGVPPCKVMAAYGQDALDNTPSYSLLDANQVNGFTCYRGRQYLTDRTNAGTATVTFNDKTGLLDPTNTSSPVYPQPANSPMQLQILNPYTGSYVAVFTGLTQDMPQTVRYQGAKMNQVNVDLVDLFSLLAISEIPPGLNYLSDSTAASIANSIGDTIYAGSTVQDRILSILADIGVPSNLCDIFSGNVFVQATVYAPGTFALTALQDAADAEFPGVSNLYVDKLGVLQFKGRLSRSDPATYGASFWKVADYDNGAPLSPSYALVAAQDFVIDSDITKCINNALFTPENILDVDIPGQLVKHTASLGHYGPRPITGQNLITAGQTAGALSPSSYANALATCRMFGQFYVNGWNWWNDGSGIPAPQVECKQITLRPIPITRSNAAYHWNMMLNVEIGDVIELSVGTPYGGGFIGSADAGQFFVEGIRTTIAPGGKIPDLTVVLDLSPRLPYLITPPTNWIP